MINPNNASTDSFTQTPETSISLDEIKAEVKIKCESFETISHKHVLNNLIERIEKVDFRKLVILTDEKETLKKKHYLISSIEHILEIAETNSWGLCRYHDFIYLYNGAYWDLLGEDDLKTFLGEASEKMSIDRYDARHYSYRDQLYKQFIALANLPRNEPMKGQVLINLKNGTFEISSKGIQLREFKREDFITYQLPFEYDSAAICPMWESYLNNVLPDIERQNILAEYLGYVFTKEMKLEKCLILYGSGGNGKSVFFDVVNALLGHENVSSFSLQSLTNENGYSRAKIANKLLNYASEINATLEASIFKQLVSGEPVEARLPYGEPFILTNYARLLFNCNQLPKEVEQTNAFFRRFIIIPFDKTIPEQEQDKDLASKIIKNELSGVFNWMLKGLNRLLAQQGFTVSTSANEELEKFKTQSDTVRIFIEEKGYEISHNNHTLCKDLYDEYKLFCVEDGYRSVSKKEFKNRLINAKIQIRKINIGFVANVYLKNILF